MKPPRPARVAAALVAAAGAAVLIAAATRHADALRGWWHGLSDAPAWTYALVMPALLVALVSQTVSPALPRWARRFAHLPALLLGLTLVLALGGPVHEGAGVPTGVLVLGLFVLPLLAGLTGVLPAALLWLLCFAGLLHLVVGQVASVSDVLDVLLAWAGLTALALGWIRLAFGQPPEPRASADAGVEAPYVPEEGGPAEAWQRLRTRPGGAAARDEDGLR